MDKWFDLKDGSTLIKTDEGIYFRIPRNESIPKLIDENEGKALEQNIA